jgi:glutathione synthase/RimK-type ligase-like ATP-grasp enzyme
MNHPQDIAVMFDKLLCHERFSAAKLPTPASLGPIEDFDDLRAKMAKANLRRVFIKLFCGSSASGVIAYRQSPREEAVTSAELVRSGAEIRLYNSLRIRSYNKPRDLADVINFILKEGAIVQEWLPKARFQGSPYDLRVVVIAQEARHFVVRLGKSPMTNLHLGNARGDAALYRASLAPGEWEKISALCQDAAALFPKSLYAGVDLLVGPGGKPKAILEINAFGDLLPNVLSNGVDTYTAELQAFLQIARRA